jgi:hypothetical protein
MQKKTINQISSLSYGPLCHVYMVNQSWLYPSTKDSCQPCQEVDNIKIYQGADPDAPTWANPSWSFFSIQYTYVNPCDALKKNWSL